MDKIATIQKKLDEFYKITGLPVSTITDAEDFRMLHPTAIINEYNSEHAMYVRRMLEAMKPKYGIPIIRDLFKSTFYAVIPVTKGITVQIGPAPAHDINMTDYFKKIKSIAPDYVFNEHFRILKGTPRVDLGYFTSAVVLVTNYICDTSITSRDVIINEDLVTANINTSAESLERTAFSVNQLAFDSDIYHIIEEGDLRRFESFQEEVRDGSHYYFQENDISYLRVAFIFYGSICCHHAVLGGVHISDVGELFSAYISELHELTRPEEFWALLPRFSRILCQRVHDINSASHSALLNECIAYIGENTYSNISLGTLEQVTNSSRKTIYKHFKDYLNTTPSEYILEKRIEEAKKMLITTDFSILDIATLLNYSSQSHFNKSFKEKYGCTPLQYRKKYKKKITSPTN